MLILPCHVTLQVGFVFPNAAEKNERVNRFQPIFLGSQTAQSEDNVI